MIIVHDAYLLSKYAVYLKGIIINAIAFKRPSFNKTLKFKKIFTLPDRGGGNVVVPGMPPQDVLDYQRDRALFDYYKQKYEKDWLRHRILPPSPFKRFIEYDSRGRPPPPPAYGPPSGKCTAVNHKC